MKIFLFSIENNYKKAKRVSLLCFRMNKNTSYIYSFSKSDNFKNINSCLRKAKYITKITKIKIIISFIFKKITFNEFTF
jgi:predicted lipase